MPSFKRADIIVNLWLSNLLISAMHEYYKCTPSAWKHRVHPISFTLVVEDLGIKCKDIKSAYHVIKNMQQQYEISIDWRGKNYLGLDIKWNYQSKHETIRIKKCAREALHKLKCTVSKPTHSPAKHAIQNYGAKPQNSVQEDKSKPLLLYTDIKHM